MTKFRWELIVEGSENNQEWREYEFKFKPSRIDKRPPLIPGYMPSFDWQLWFIPLGVKRGESFPDWYNNFLKGLLEGRKQTLTLLANNPFPDHPPHYLRTQIYSYTYAPPDSSQWWTRELKSTVYF